MKSSMVYWDPDTGIAKCVLTTKDGTVHIGTATCADVDRDMMNEKTGCQIAEIRALIAYFKHMRDNELKPALKGLKQYWNTINKSKYYDENSYPVQMLLRTIQRYEDDIKDVNVEINNAKDKLKQYITLKDAFYTTIRKMRNRKKYIEERENRTKKDN